MAMRWRCDGDLVVVGTVRSSPPTPTQYNQPTNDKARAVGWMDGWMNMRVQEIS